MMDNWTQSKVKVPESHKIGRRAVDILRYKLPSSWIVQQSGQDSDYGIDLRVEVIKDGYHTGTDFNIQVKGTTIIPKKSKRWRVHLKRSTVSYLLNKISPTMIALCDIPTERVYYAWLQSAIDSITTKRTESATSFEIDFRDEILSDFEPRASQFLESYYKPIFLGLRNSAKIQHLTYGSFHVAQAFESLSHAFIMGLMSLLHEKGEIEISEPIQDSLPWAVTWATNVLCMFFPLFKKFMEIYEDKYFSEESLADQQLMQSYQELRTTVSSFLPVADIENERGPNIIDAGDDFLMVKSDAKIMWEKTPKTLDRLQALSAKLREIVFIAWKLEKRAKR